jgi:hypothetical protein
MHRDSSRTLALGSTVAILLCLTQAGCISDLSGIFDGQVLLRDDIEADDEDGLFPSVRANFDLLEKRHPPRQGVLQPGVFRSGASDPDAPQTGAPEVPDSGGALPNPPTEARDRKRARPTLSVDLEYAVGLGGNDAQAIRGVDDYIDYDGTLFVGPQTLQQRWDLHLGTVGVRTGGRFFDVLSLEGLAGLSTTAMQLEIRGPTARSSDTGVSIGAHLGARATISPHPVFDLFGEGRFHLLGGLQGSRRTVALATAMVGGDLHMTSNLSVFGGWRWWSYYEDVHHASDLDDIVLTGPTFGMLLRF